MLKRPVIESKYVGKTREIVYCGSRDDMTAEQASAFLSKGHDKLDNANLKNTNLENDNLGDYVINNGHIFQVLATHIDVSVETDSNEADPIDDSKFEVIGWIEWAPQFPYDFLLRHIETDKYFAATLIGRSDGWPLFAIQNEKPTCSRTRMGSDWNCRLCVKYFGTTCKAW